jgi:lysophospholipase L1-like esterase
MARRTLHASAGRLISRALVVLALAALAACGGGGGGGDSATASNSAAPEGGGASSDTTAVVPAPTAAASQNIAAWGDSLTPAYARELAILYPGRQVYDGGVIGETSTEIAARQLADTSEHRTWINIFWYGHNNIKDPARIKADIAGSVAALAPGNTRFLVLSVVNEATPEASRGGPEYATVMQLNSELAATYPQNYLDIRTFLVSQYDPSSAQDRIDFGNDVVASSLRFDKIHLNYPGQQLVGRKVKEAIDARGW